MPSVDNTISQIQIRSITEKYDYILSLGWRLVVVSEDDKEYLTQYKSKYEIPYRMCSVKDKRVSELLNLSGEIGILKRNTILFNKSFEIIKRFDEIIPGTHHNHVIQWIEHNTSFHQELNSTRSKSGSEGV